LSTKSHAGLESGADDYITKPFELPEVLARIRTVMRRAGRRPALAAATPAPATPPDCGDILLFQDWHLDLTRRELRKSTGTPVPLTSGEFELLRVFARHPNRVLSRDQLMDLIKGRNWFAYDRAIDTQVGRLRKKIVSDLGNLALTKTVRGGGYVFATPVKAG
jgi:DNA-binding response OmpR family regulator